MTLLIFYAVVTIIGAGVALWRVPVLPSANWLLILAAVPQVVALSGSRSMIGVIWSLIFITSWIYKNRTVPGTLYLLVGGAMNLITMALHDGAMPLHQDILAVYDGHMYDHGTALIGSKDVIVSTSPLLILSDWIDIPIWGKYGIIASPGDVMIAMGIIRWLWRKDTPCSTQQQAQCHSSVYPTDVLDPI